MESRRLYTSYSMDAVTRERNETNLLGGNFLKALNDVSKVNDTGNIHSQEIDQLKEMMDAIWQSQKYILSDEP